MVNSINSELITMQNTTKKEQAKNSNVGANQELGQDMFLQLMMEQLKYQDPLEPMDNTEFLTQQAQFTQVSSLQSLQKTSESIQSSLESCIQYSQISSMMGNKVLIKGDNDTEITGTVEAVNFNGNSPSVVVNGKEYPINNVIQIRPGNNTEV